MDTRSGNIRRLKRNSIKTLPRKLQVGIQTTTHASSILKLGEGVKVSDSTSATAVHGYIERVGGPINTLTITNSGKGFTPSQTYNNVPLFAITGNGSGATATVATNSSGQVSSISITSNVGGGGLLPVHLPDPIVQQPTTNNDPPRHIAESDYHINLKAESIPQKFQVRTFGNDGITPKPFTLKGFLPGLSTLSLMFIGICATTNSGLANALH